MVIVWSGFLTIDIIATAPSDNIFVNKSGGGVKGLPISRCKWGKNGQKLNFQANGGRWRDNGVETAWNSFLFVYIIAIASSDNIFVNQSGGRIKGLPKKRRKWG